METDNVCEICGTEESLARVRFQRDLPTMYAGPVDDVRVLCGTCRGIYRGDCEDAFESIPGKGGNDSGGWHLVEKYKDAVHEGRLEDYVKMIRWSFNNLEVKIWGKPNYPFITYHSDEGTGTVVSAESAKFDDAVRRELGLEYAEKESWLVENYASEEAMGKAGEEDKEADRL